jgi:hypothetical protein
VLDFLEGETRELLHDGCGALNSAVLEGHHRVVFLHRSSSVPHL